VAGGPRRHISRRPGHLTGQGGCTDLTACVASELPSNWRERKRMREEEEALQRSKAEAGGSLCGSPTKPVKKDKKVPSAVGRRAQHVGPRARAPACCSMLPLRPLRAAALL
jgi:hypothetical protein